MFPLDKKALHISPDPPGGQSRATVPGAKATQLLVVGLHRLDPKLANVAYARVSYDAGELLALAAAGASSGT